MADIITLFAATGCRISELLAIRINEDIDRVAAGEAALDEETG